jgi:starch synthase
VQNFQPATGTGNGFKFGPYNAGALLEKIREALYFYGVPEAWPVIQQNGMAADNSWSAAAAKYIELYREIMKL